MIQLCDVTKRYGDAVILDQANYTFPEHGVVCLMGASGGGKTTLLKSINKLPAVTNPKEELKKNGMTVTEYTPEMIKRFYEATAGVRADWTQKIGPDVVKAAEEDMKAAK